MLILVTGATGFIGSHVVRALRGRGVLLGVHRAAGSDPAAPRIDVTDAASLAGLCRGVEMVFHCVSYIGGDAERCEAVNAGGTRALVAEAMRAGVRRFVYISTAAVYGAGAFRGIAEGQAPSDPSSAVSHSRLAAEEAVLAAGGLVLRPYFVYGTGDLWFIPAVVSAVRRLEGLPSAGTALLSLVEVNDLARVAVAAADAGMHGTYHAAHPEPVRLLDICSALTPGILEVKTVASTARCPAGIGTVDPSDWHRMQLISTDHWLDSRRVWAETASDPGPGYTHRIAAHRAWYETHLRA